MHRTVKCLTELIRSAIADERIEFCEDFEKQFETVIHFAESHEIGPLVATGLINNGLLKEKEHIEKCRHILFKASYADSKNQFACDEASRCLNGCGITFIKLKGAVIKELYPQAYLRTSCDTDILIHKKDLKNALSVLTENGFKQSQKFNFHDVSLFLDGANLELHFSLCENIKRIDSLLKDVWKYSDKKDGFEYSIENNYFVFHHIAHMFYHLFSGGCGIRPFVDFWLMQRAGFFDDQKVTAFCEQAKISEFYMAVKKLIEVWFENKPHSDLTKRFESFILEGGAYGVFKNSFAIRSAEKGGRLRYILSLAFPNYNSISVNYPILKKLPFLLPFCYIYRIFERVFGKKRKKIKTRYEVLKGRQDDYLKDAQQLATDLNISRRKK